MKRFRVLCCDSLEVLACRHCRLSAALAVSVLAVGIAGCGEGRVEHSAVYPVEGQVIWNGKPLAGAMVILYPQGEAKTDVRAAAAQTGPDGRFRVGTYDAGDAAPEGQYAVTVVHFPLVQRGGDSVPSPNVLPAKYASPKTTDLHVQVAKGANTLPALVLNTASEVKKSSDGLSPRR